MSIKTSHTPVKAAIAPQFDSSLIRRYEGRAPRYTSYPTAMQFSESVGNDQYRVAVNTSNELFIPHPLSLYVHIPFCDTICYYCACNKVVTANRDRVREYVELLLREIEIQAKLYDVDREIVQMHFGGGTPLFLDSGQFDVAIDALDRHFSLSTRSDRDFAIELDPSNTQVKDIYHLTSLGFNRFSIGVQDLDEKVQKAVNRKQSLEQIQAVVEACRNAGAHSVNIDLIYGLPHQTTARFSATVGTVLEKLQPDRLSIFKYAHLPAWFKSQRHIDAADLPSPAKKMKILETSIRALVSAGYVHIGMNHFALRSDSLVVALNSGTLQRNFQGYSTHGNCDLLGLGVSAISNLGGGIFQNAIDLKQYSVRIQQGDLAVDRGVILSEEDRIRAEIIQQLMCYHQFSAVTIESLFAIDFKKAFSWELQQLKKMQQDGLLVHDRDVWSVTARGRLLIRSICAVFDAYQQPQTATGFSRLV
ncbi:MAG: oxygen-independent coproporphyrinogen III oxidase [Pseudomonadota bacterium]